MKYLSICAIFKNESLYLEDWIKFHIEVGVEHFYLFNNDSTDNYMNIINKYKEYITLEDFSGLAKQRECYNYCLNKYKFDSRWIAFIDIDEYLYLRNGNVDIKNELINYEAYGGLVVGWIFFGSNGILNKSTKAVYNRFFNCMSVPTDAMKSIINPIKTECVGSNSHHFIYIDREYAVDENYRPSHNEFKGTVRKFAINHYCLKSKEEYEEKINKGYVDAIISPYNWNLFLQQDSECIYKDLGIFDVINKIYIK